MLPADVYFSHGGATPAGQGALRRHNLGAVLRHVRDVGPRSRARIAAETGLNKATVSSLVAELVDRGLLREGDAERGPVGRPAQAVAVDGHRVCGIGAEVNVGYLAVLALDVAGEVVIDRRVALDTGTLDPSVVLDRLAGLLGEAIDAVESRDAHPAGITLALPGLVETESGTLQIAPNLGWSSVPVVPEVVGRLGSITFPLLVDNEANLAAIAEVAEGSAVGHRDLVLLTGAAGIGGGIVSGGRLVRGVHGFGGEVGHMSVDPGGRPCACGRTGCWETVAGLTALLAEAAAPDDPVRDPSLDIDDRLAEINRRAELGDARTLSALHRVGSWLGAGASILVNALNPAAVILGGYLAAVGRWLTEPVAAELASRVIAPRAGGCRVALSTLGFSAAVRGGAQVALESVFNDPTVVLRDAAGTPSLSIGGPA